MANHPHNKDRPEIKAVRKALKAGDMNALAKALTVRQRRFCEEYILDFNGSAAAVRAGYSPKYADRQAYQLLKQHDGCIAYIDHLTRSKEAKIMSVNPDYVIQRVMAIINNHEAKDGDKLRGLELLARHLGMFIDRTEITGKDGGAIETKKIAEDAADFARAIADMVKRNDVITIVD